ncbi:anti-sigma regulatory factor [Cyanobacterium stanieri LEGE 03274]|uniref:Anti-sigma regulatory factor n=1 Tax=Cyanobacterium stanieri LEGE 03274 TaxID=1828756 RepID=A0ABR9V7Y1_9CHRO|nr:anti-sigma regulatory factor [Cyanobacterium stanieri]MBE9222934.1 anti-sigma regulatory factor [Cyanobacterium stanieri LEGE 03274]
MNAVKQISFVVPSDLLCLGEVLGKYEEVKPESIDQRIWLECQLALAEGFTNAVRHAHKNLSPETTIEIEIIINPSDLLIRIWDQGNPFSLLSLKELTSAEDQLKIGGRGIEILEKVTDELKYERYPDNRNCLIIKRNLTHSH